MSKPVASHRRRVRRVVLVSVATASTVVVVSTDEAATLPTSTTTATTASTTTTPTTTTPTTTTPPTMPPPFLVMTVLSAECREDDAYLEITSTAIVDVPDGVFFRVHFPPLSDGIPSIQGSLGPLSAGESASSEVQVLEGRDIVVEVVSESGSLIGGGQGGLVTPTCGDAQGGAAPVPATAGANRPDPAELPATR